MEKKTETLRKAVAIAEERMRCAVVEAEDVIAQAKRLNSFSHLAHNLASRCVAIAERSTELEMLRQLRAEADLEETMRAGEALEREEWFDRRTEDELRSIHHDAAMNGAELPHGITIGMIEEELHRHSRAQLSEEQNERRQLGVSAL